MSLGWLSESSSMHRKSSKPIRGVGQSSVLGLRAALLQQEEWLKRTQNDPELRKQAAKERIAKLVALKRHGDEYTNAMDVERRDLRAKRAEDERDEIKRQNAAGKYSLYEWFSKSEAKRDEYL
jgi:hypothetical protein